MTKVTTQQLLILKVMPPYGPSQNHRDIAKVVGCTGDTCRAQLGKMRENGFVDCIEGRWGITPEGRLVLAEQVKAIEQRESLFPKNTLTLDVTVTAELGEKIEKAAKERLVTPEHLVNCTLASHFADREKTSWLSPPILLAILKGISNALAQLAAEKTQEEK